MKLGWRQEGIDRVGEEDQVRRRQLLPGRGEVLLELPDALTYVERLEGDVRELLLNILHREQRDAVLPRRGTVQHQYSHTFSPVSLSILICPNSGLPKRSPSPAVHAPHSSFK